MEAFSRTMGSKDAIPITDENKSQVDAVLSAYKNISVKSYESKLTEATNFVLDRNIQELPDGGINANASWLVYTPDQAYNCAYYVASLAYAAIDKANTGARDNLIKLTRYMLLVEGRLVCYPVIILPVGNLPKVSFMQCQYMKIMITLIQE